MRTWSPRIKRAVTNWLALPQDALLDASRVTCIDGSEVVVENVIALEQVSATDIQLRLDNVVLKLHGDNFEVTLVAGQEIHIRGRIGQISYIRSEGESR